MPPISCLCIFVYYYISCMSFSPFHTRSGIIYSSFLNMPDDTESLTATAGAPSPTPPPTSTVPPVHHVSLSPASVPQWSGDDPQYPVFMFIRRLCDALSHTSFNSEQCVTFARQCMSLNPLTPAGAALEDDFYSNCTDFEAFVITSLRSCLLQQGPVANLPA